MTASVLSLPNEILLSVLSFCSSLHDAVQFSYSNHRLQSIWLQYTDHVVDTILRVNWPAYEEALNLALAEHSTPSVVGVRDWRQLLPLLRHNAALASRAEASWLRHIARLPERHYRHNLPASSFPTPYYLMRQFVHSYHRPELRPRILAALDSPDMLRLSCELCALLIYYEGEDARVAHGFEKDRDLWTWEEERFGEANKDEWEWAYQTLQDMVDERGLRVQPEDLYK